MYLKFLITYLIIFAAHGNTLIKIQGGDYKPLFGKGESSKVNSFYINETAVTNEEYQAFLKLNPQWKKNKIIILFADKNYLKSDLKNLNLQAPVVNVSWFAAKAYCEAKGLRLPTIEEWEYLAQFGPNNKVADVNQYILDWYSKPTPKKLPPVRSTFKNKFGVWDIHGLIWEWTYDFNTTFVTGESRGDSALEKSMFCGSGSIGAANPKDYAAFMRFGFRSSLKGNYTVENLGFRCVKEIHE